MKDLEKRRRVMARSVRLGHCICNVAKSCPCDVFREQDLCPCAGEHAEATAAAVPLTSLARRAGCASKIDHATLARVLAGLPFLDDPRVLVGAPAGDDAGIYRLDAKRALVQTVDVFSPSVDDPYTFGQIAAANSLSDVYAMGGQPLTALSIIGFPLDSVAEEVLREILRGGVDKMTEAGVPVIGGHSINDAELKAGFAVTGMVHPDRIVTNAGARPGDCLVLTKPLGTGVLSFAGQLGRAPAEGLAAAALAMTTLNDGAARAMVACGAQAATDVTGFGLAGHLTAMASASKVAIDIDVERLPLLPGVRDCLAAGIASGAVERNRDSFAASLAVDDGVPPELLEICFDPQTSGGLVIAIAAAAVEQLLTQLRAEGIAAAAIIGRVTDGPAGRVRVRYQAKELLVRNVALDRGAGFQPAGSAADCKSALRNAVTSTAAVTESNEETGVMSCCDNHQPAQTATEAGSPTPDTSERKYQEFLHAAFAPGALDGKTKRAVAIALSVAMRCEPCLQVHLGKARSAGFSPEEIDEAAWMGIAFGGSPAMAFYRAAVKAAQPTAK
jgi:selenide, water dikinase